MQTLFILVTSVKHNPAYWVELSKIHFVLIFHQHRKWPGGRENQLHYIWFSRAFCSELIQLRLAGQWCRVASAERGRSLSYCETLLSATNPHFFACKFHTVYLPSLSKQEREKSKEMTWNIKSLQGILFSRVIDLRRVKPIGDFTLRFCRTNANNTTAHISS